MVSPEDQSALLRLARESIEARLRGAPEPELPRAACLKEPRGVFVTLHRRHPDDGEPLRGCLGSIEPRAPLGEEVRRLAWMAASQDRRFEPVKLEELDDVQIEISVLSPLQAIAPESIEIGRHGLVVEELPRAGGYGHRRGLLLPQVASERGWDVPTFLRHTCLKAGLPPDAWKTAPGVKLEAFTCEVFGEDVEQV